MKTMMVLGLLICLNAKAGSFEDVSIIAQRNGFKPSQRVITAIINASSRYGVDPLELAALSILETGMGKYATIRKNHNGSYDKGLFQINTINTKTCIEYNLDSIEGNSMCAAKLLKSIKNRFKKDPKAVARYHSGTKKFKDIYFDKFAKVYYATAE